MYDNIDINDEVLNDIDCMRVTDVDDYNNKYEKLIYYLSDSARIKIITLIHLYHSSKSSFGVYIKILQDMSNSGNKVRITRKEFKNALGLSDSSISLAISELKEHKLIEEKEKDVFSIPFNTAHKGNLTKIVTKYKEYKACAERDKIEREQRDSINKLNLIRKTKIKRNKNND